MIVEMKDRIRDCVPMRCDFFNWCCLYIFPV